MDKPLPPLQNRIPLKNQLTPAKESPPPQKIANRPEALWFSKRVTHKERVSVRLNGGWQFSGIIEWQDNTFFKIVRDGDASGIVIRKAAVECMWKDQEIQVP